MHDCQLNSHREDWVVTSNVESGDGYSDILVELEEEGVGIVIEVKYAKNLEQIERMGYGEFLLENEMNTILKYGIACCKKKCKVQLASLPAAFSAE